MRRATLARTCIAAAACALVAVTFAACAHRDGYRGGTYTSFTFRPPPAASPATSPAPAVAQPGAVARGDLDRWIRNDEAALRGPARATPSAYGAHLASLLNELWLAHRDRELAQRLATLGARLPGASDDRADARFLHGDDDAGFDAVAARHTELRDARSAAAILGWYAFIDRLRGIRESAAADGRSIDAALLEGDVYARCGRYGSARVTWYRAFSTSVLQRPERYRFFPAWTSAMRRLLRHRSTPDRPFASAGCRRLPPPVVDPLG
jgi:hypothetical protein